MHHHIGQQLRRSLLRRDAGHLHIAEAVIHKGGGIALLPLTAGIGIQMDNVLVVVPAAGFVGKPAVIQIEAAIQQLLRMAQLDLLPGRRIDRQPAHTGIRYTEIVHKAVVLRPDLDRPALLSHQDRLRLTPAQHTARRAYRDNRLPAAVVETRLIPAGQLPAGIVGLAETIIVRQQRRRCRAERGIAEQHLLPTGRVCIGQLQRQLRRAAVGRLVKLPRIAAGIVLKTIAQPYADHIFPRLQRKCVLIIIHQVIRVADIRCQPPLGAALPVDVQLIEAAHGNTQPALAGRRRKATADIRCRHRRLKGIVCHGGLHKGCRKIHRSFLRLSVFRRSRKAGAAAA